MNRKPASKKKRGSRVGETKILIGALALTSALGFWNLFSRQAMNDLASAAQSQDNTSGAATTSPDVSTNSVVLVLPPMPTLVPEQQSGTLALQPVPTAPAAVSVVSNPTAPQQGKILLGGSQPGAAQPSTAGAPAKRKAPKPVTSTRSSR